MEKSFLDIDSILSQTEYFKSYVSQLLGYFASTLQCPKSVLSILIHGPEGSGKELIVKLASQRLSSIAFNKDQVFDLLDDNNSIDITKKKVKSALLKHLDSAPCLIYWSYFELFCDLEENDIQTIEQAINETLLELANTSTKPIIFVGSTQDFGRVYRSRLFEIFLQDIKLKPPTIEQAKEILQALLSSSANFHLDADAIFHSSVTSIRELYLGNLLHLWTKYEINQFREQHYGTGVQGAESEGTKWLDVGGLSQIKKVIIDTIQRPLNYPQLKKSGLRRTGILLHGPPGTGKTLLARAVASECGLNFIDIKGPELLNEYVGESEGNLRQLFQRARDSSPCVLFFDEIDSLAPARGQSGDSGGVMDRMVSQLLVEMDGVGKGDDVYVMGTTNRVDKIDQALLRPGRFDKVLEVPVPTSSESRLDILRAITRKMTLSDDVSLDLLESMAPANVSGAFFQLWCDSAAKQSIHRCIESIEAGLIGRAEAKVVVESKDFKSALKVINR